MENTFIESDCTIELDGKKFTSGGAWLAECSDGKMRGVVYIRNEHNGYCDVGTWHGQKIANAKYTDYRGNFCKMRRISFTRAGKVFVGDYCPDWADACKVRTTK